MRRIEYYRTESGRCPVKEFLDSLSGKEFLKVDKILRLISETPIVPREYFQKMPGTDDIWEVRAQYGGASLRLLGFWAGSNLILLTNGFDKKSEKTPRTEIELAERRKKDYLRRHKP